MLPGTSFGIAVSGKASFKIACIGHFVGPTHVFMNSISDSVKTAHARSIDREKNYARRTTLLSGMRSSNMAEVTEAALANRTKQVIFWGCCCHSVVLACGYVQAAAVETVHINGSVSVQASDACISVEHPASWYVLSFNARDNRWSVHINAGERAECSLCDGHAMTNVSVVSAVTLHSRTQIGVYSNE